jgi:hypothetical protein
VPRRVGRAGRAVLLFSVFVPYKSHHILTCCLFLCCSKLGIQTHLHQVMVTGFIATLYPSSPLFTAVQSAVQSLDPVIVSTSLAALALFCLRVQQPGQHQVSAGGSGGKESQGQDRRHTEEGEPAAPTIVPVSHACALRQLYLCLCAAPAAPARWHWCASAVQTLQCTNLHTR